jgi:hypothetical protein
MDGSVISAAAEVSLQIVNGRVVTKKAGTYGTTTISIRMEIKTATEEIGLLTDQK